MSMYILICLQRKLSLFLKEFLFRCPNINQLMCLTRISLRVLIAFEKVVPEALEKFLYFNIRTPNGLKSQSPSINCSKFFGEIPLTFLFR